MDGCKSNTAKSFTAKAGGHIPSGFSIATVLSSKEA